MANDQFQGVEKFLPGLVGSAGALLWIKGAWYRRVAMMALGSAASYYGAPTSFINADGVATVGNSATTGDVRVAQIAWGGAPAQMQQPLGGSLLLVDVSGY